MKQILLLSLLLNLTMWGYAQQPSVTGRLIDPDNLSVPGVAVVMQTLDSVYVDAVVSDVNGNFKIVSDMRPYRLLIQHIAYKSLKLESDKDNLGNIRLEEAVNELSDVVVKADRPIMKMDNGKLAYDLRAISEGKLLDNTFDLVKELPSISSEGGGISIIGNMGGTDILISGKKSNMSTDQMIEYLRALPPTQVEKIEVVYNPPASWHVQGSAINIILKKENRYSLQGQVQGRYTNQYANSYMTGGSLFLSSPNLSFDLIYNFNDDRKKTKNEQRSLHTVGDKVHDIEMSLLEHGHHLYHNVYSSLNYNFKEKSNLDLSYVGKFSPKNNQQNTNRNNYFPNAYSNIEKDDWMHDISLTYTSPFGLKAGTEYNRYTNNGLQAMQHFNEIQTTDVLAYEMSQQVHHANLFIDMEHSLPKNWQLDYGIKYDYTQNKNSQALEDKANMGNGDYQNSSETKEHITNMHLGLGKSFFDGKLSVSASLETELYKINDYKEHAFLPNASVSYRLNANHSFQMGYRSYQVYPSYWDRQEYTTYLDDYNVEMGNPLLRPAKFSFTQLMYILHRKYIFQALYLNADDYFIMQDYQSVNTLQKIQKTINLDRYSMFLLTAAIPVQIANVWSANFSAYVKNDLYKASQWFDLSYNRNKWAAGITINNTVTLLKKPMVTFNALLYYKSPYIIGIYDMKTTLGANVGIKWEIIKDKAILNFQCNDLFNSGYAKIGTRYANQHLDMDYTAYQRNFMVSFSYSFKGYKDRSAKNVDTSRYGL